MTTNTEYTPETDPALNIRSDLWPSMSLGQLARQQDLVITKISMMHQMMGINASQSLINLYSALQVALNDLTDLINSRSDKNSTRN